MLIEYLSHSRLETFRQCPLAFHDKYVDKVGVEDKENNHYGLHGSAIHEVLELWGKRQQAQNPASEDELTEYLLSVYPDATQFPQGKYEEYRESALYALRTFLKYNVGITPLMCEQTILAQIDANLPVFKMIIDRVDGSPDTGSREWDVIDYKSARPYDKKKLDSKFQLTIYAKGIQAIHGELPKRLTYYHVCHNQKIPVHLTPLKIDRDMMTVRETWDAIQKETEWAGKYDYFFCNKICDLRGTCEHLKRSKSAFKWGGKAING